MDQEMDKTEDGLELVEESSAQEPSVVVESPRKSRRKKRTDLGRHRKKERKPLPPHLKKSHGTTASTGDSTSVASDTASDSASSSRTNLKDQCGCHESVMESHFCLDSDNFSESVQTSELDEDDVIDVVGDSDSDASKASADKKLHEVSQLPFDPSHDTSSDLALVPEVDVDFEELQKNLKLLLSEEWTVTVSKEKALVIVALRLSESDKPSVEFSVVWKQNQVAIYVHGFLVPKHCKIFSVVAGPEEYNIGSIADCLKELTDKIMSSKVCSGVSEFQDLWTIHKGHIDRSGDRECFRSASCTLLIVNEEKTCCLDCILELQRLRRHAKRKEEAKNISYVADQYLSKDGLQKKKDFFVKKLKAEKQRSQRLGKQVEDLKVKLNEALHDEFLAILRTKEHLMSPLQLVFWRSQRDALLVDDKRGMRWHPMMIRIALHLQHLSMAATDYLREINVIELPSKRRLYDYSHFIDFKEGCQPEILKIIKERLDDCGSEDHNSYINLLFDEMHIRAGIVTRKSSGEIIGYTNLSEIEQELEHLQAEVQGKKYKPKLAKKVLVYLAEGITSDVKDVVAVYSTENLSASQLYDRTWNVLYNLEGVGIKVLTLTCDGAAVNRKFINMHKSFDSRYKFVYSTKNLASGCNRPLYFIVDPPHLLKTTRNCLANSFCHKRTRKMSKNGEHLSWKVIEAVYELTREDVHRSHKLTKAHVKLTSFSCMDVHLAAQVLSSSVARTISTLKENKCLENEQTNELVKFIKLMDRFFDCCNGTEKNSSKESAKADHQPFTSVNDERFDFLENTFLDYFEEWKTEVVNAPNTTEKKRSRMILSHQSLEAIQITVHSLVKAIKFMLVEAKAPKIYSNVFNQDSLEQYFSTMRRRQGDNRNPSLKAFGDTTVSIIAQGSAAMPSTRGNTSVEKRPINVDPSPLPSRKKPKST